MESHMEVGASNWPGGLGAAQGTKHSAAANAAAEPAAEPLDREGFEGFVRCTSFADDVMQDLGTDSGSPVGCGLQILRQSLATARSSGAPWAEEGKAGARLEAVLAAGDPPHAGSGFSAFRLVGVALTGHSPPTAVAVRPAAQRAEAAKRRVEAAVQCSAVQCKSVRYG